MKLEEATSNNTYEYSLTGKYFRVKMLGTMKCNVHYASFAVEFDKDTIYKAYVFGENATHKKVGDIFHVKFGEQLNDEELTRIYRYALCNENGITSCSDNIFKLDYENYFTQEFTEEYAACMRELNEYISTMDD